MSAEVAFFAIPIVLFAVGFSVVYLRRRALLLEPFRPCTSPLPEGLMSVDGGAFVGRTSVSWPFARLSLTSEHAYVVLKVPVANRCLIAQRQDVTRVALRRGILGVGVHFYSSAGRSAVTFWLLRRGDMKSRLDRLGWSDEPTTADRPD